MLSTKFQIIWCISKDIMGIYLILGKFGKKVWGRVINPLWCLKAPSSATKKWIFEFCTKFGFRNHLQTFWPRRLVKSELSLGLLRNSMVLINISNFKYCHNLVHGFISNFYFYAIDTCAMYILLSRYL